MNDLYNELTSNNTQYLENGEMRSNPPNLLQLRAARALKQSNEEREGVVRAYMSISLEFDKLTKENAELTQQILQLNKFTNELITKYDTIRAEPDASSTIESVCNGEQQVSNVGDKPVL